MIRPDQIDKLPKYRRDWLEIWGNIWQPKQKSEPLTAEEKADLERALNPFAERTS